MTWRSDVRGGVVFGVVSPEHVAVGLEEILVIKRFHPRVYSVAQLYDIPHILQSDQYSTKECESMGSSIILTKNTSYNLISLTFSSVEEL